MRAEGERRGEEGAREVARRIRAQAVMHACVSVRLEERESLAWRTALFLRSGLFVCRCRFSWVVVCAPLSCGAGCDVGFCARGALRLAREGVRSLRCVRGRAVG